MPESTTKNPPLFTKVCFETHEEAENLYLRWRETDTIEVDSSTLGRSIYNASTGEWIYLPNSADNFGGGYLKTS